MACCTFASAQANNHSKTTQSLPAQRNCATTTTLSAHVTTLVKKDDFAPRSIADEGIENFEVSKRFPYTPRRFQRKTVALANRQEPQPFHHAPRTRHRNFQTKSSKKANHSRRPASKQASIRVDSAKANLLSLVCHGHQQRMNCSLKKRACVRCQWQKCKTASVLKHMPLQTAYKGESAFVLRYIPLLDQHG